MKFEFNDETVTVYQCPGCEAWQLEVPWNLMVRVVPDPLLMYPSWHRLQVSVDDSVLEEPMLEHAFYCPPLVEVIREAGLLLCMVPRSTQV
jgi:hypothetical protein